MMLAYLTEIETVKAGRSTPKQYRARLKGFARFLEDTGRAREFSRSNVADWQAHMLGLGRAKATVSAYVRTVGACWRWAYDHPDYGEHVGRVSMPPAVEVPRKVTQAPTWAQCAEGVAAAYQSSEWRGRLWEVLYYSGLRLRQGAALQAEWFAPERGTFTLPPSARKTKGEQPVRAAHPALLERVREWCPRGFGPLLGETMPQRVEAGAALVWSRTSVPEHLYRQPHHCFRQAFETGLLEAGAPWVLVEALVGHAVGTGAAHYVDWSRIEEMKRVVAMVPRLGDAPALRVVGRGGA